MDFPPTKGYGVWKPKWEDLSEEEIKIEIASFQEKLRGDLASYVSREDMSNIQAAENEYEADTDNETRFENFLGPLSVAVENTEERFNREQNAVKNLNQLMEEIREHLADKDPENGRAPSSETQKLQLKLQLKTTEPWLNEQLRKHHNQQQPQPAKALDAIVDEIEEMYQNLCHLYRSLTGRDPQSQTMENRRIQIMSCLEKLDGPLKDCLSKEDAAKVQSAKEQLATDENSPHSLLDLLSGIVNSTENRWNRMNNGISALKKLLEKIRDEQKEDASLAQATDLQLSLKTTEPWLSEKIRSLQQPHSAEDMEKIITEIEEMHKDLNRIYQEKQKPPTLPQQPQPTQTNPSQPNVIPPWAAVPPLFDALPFIIGLQPQPTQTNPSQPNVIPQGSATGSPVIIRQVHIRMPKPPQPTQTNPSQPNPQPTQTNPSQPNNDKPPDV